MASSLQSITASSVAMSENNPLQAALSAAAELAKNGGMLTFNPMVTMPAAGSHPRPTIASSTSSTAGSHSTLPSSIAAMISAATAVASFGEQNSHASLGSPGPRPNPSPRSLVDTEETDDQNSNEEDAERRMVRSRERNKEHARRTRLRKKAQLTLLQDKVKALQAESKVLTQSLEEHSIASILVGLSTGTERESLIQSLIAEATNIQNSEILKVVAGKRKRFLSDAETTACDQRSTTQALEIDINGKRTKLGGGQNHINWKTGVYKDENGMEGQLTHVQLESLR